MKSKTNIKRIITLLVACALLASCTVALTSCLEDIFGRTSTFDEASGLSFYKTADRDGYYVAADASMTNYVIPDEYDGKPVVGIVKNGFSEYNGKYKSITVPSTLTYVAPGGLAYSESCKYNEYEGAYYLGNSDNPYVVLVRAFASSVVVADGCNTIIDDAISADVSSLIISSSVKYISNNAFDSAKGVYKEKNGELTFGLKTVKVAEDNENYKSINDKIVTNKSGTRLLCLVPHAEMAIPSTVEFIEQGAILSGYGIYIPVDDDGNQYIPSEDNPYFYLASATGNKTVRDGVKVIGRGACQNGDYSVPSSVVQVMPEAFWNNVSVVSIASDGWFCAESYMDGLAYDMVCDGVSDNQVFYAKEGEWEDIVEQDPNFTNEKEYRRYED